MKTYSAKNGEISRRWFVVDAEGQILGRLASKVARVLSGKEKAVFTNHVDTGDFVVVVNAEKIRLTGQKLDQKVYYRHSGFPGGIRSMTAREMIERKPENVIKSAVKGMLPKSRLGTRMLGKLKIYAGSDHPHEAQKPEKMEL